ncbi:hypothetical protein [Wolbachia endosymbiont (group E) of Neria commutata]|uniref:hypothetical protein n=1 Tax=Wolbachia endosymbiont (group E) of Neria commutata TaxID=3066149 RepID=UPI003132AFBB
MKKPEEAEGIQVYSFNHSEENIKDRLTTYMFAVKEQNNKNRIFVFHIQEDGSKEPKYNKHSFTEEVLNKIGLKQETPCETT